MASQDGRWLPSEAMALRLRLGVRIKELRRLRRLSQEDLAATVGTSQRELSGYETGTVFPRPERIEELALALGVQVRDLFDVDAPAERYPADVEAVVRVVRAQAAKDPTFPRRLTAAIRAFLRA